MEHLNQSIMPRTVIPFFKQARTKFQTLESSDQCVVIMNILRLMDNKTPSADVTKLGGTPSMGTFKASDILDVQGTKIIYQSPTGYYRKVINLSDFL